MEEGRGRAEWARKGAEAGVLAGLEEDIAYCSGDGSIETRVGFGRVEGGECDHRSKEEGVCLREFASRVKNSSSYIIVQSRSMVL